MMVLVRRVWLQQAHEVAPAGKPSLPYQLRLWPARTVQVNRVRKLSHQAPQPKANNALGHLVLVTLPP